MEPRLNVMIRRRQKPWRRHSLCSSLIRRTIFCLNVKCTTKNWLQKQ